MTHRRRVTDGLPVADMVSRGNLDDRLANVDEKVRASSALSDERWAGHRDQHSDLATSLREYKAEANEWRRTVSDLRADFLLKSEFQSEHKALGSVLSAETGNLSSKLESIDGRLDAIERTLGARIDTVERAVQSINDREITTRAVLSQGRNLIILAFTIIGGLIGVALYLGKP